MLKGKKTLYIIGPRSVGGAEGGIENQIFLLLPYLSKKYNIVVFVDEKYVRVSERRVREIGIKNVKIEGIKAPSSRMINKIYISLISTIHALRDKPDIIYYNGFGSCLPLPLMKFSKRTQIVVHIRSYDVLYPDWNLLGKMLFALIIMFIRFFADKIISVNLIFQRLISKGYKKEVYLLENAALPPKDIYDRDLLKDFLNTYGFVPTEKKYILFAGRITPFKRIELLIRGYLRSTIKDSHNLLIVGDIADKRYYERIKKIIPSEYKDKIIFLGKVDKKFMGLLYKNACCMVLPSLFEGMPNVVIESCSYNIPTYVSRIAPHISLKFLKKEAYFSNEDELGNKLKNPKKTCIRSYLTTHLHPKKISSKLIEIFEN